MLFIGALSGALGLMLAYQLDIAAGGTIVLVSVGLFFVTLFARLIRGRL